MKISPYGSLDELLEDTRIHQRTDQVSCIECGGELHLILPMVPFLTKRFQVIF